MTPDSVDSQPVWSRLIETLISWFLKIAFF